MQGREPQPGPLLEKEHIGLPQTGPTQSKKKEVGGVSSLLLLSLLLGSPLAELIASQLVKKLGPCSLQGPVPEYRAGEEEKSRYESEEANGCTEEQDREEKKGKEWSWQGHHIRDQMTAILSLTLLK
jgi:hypothetical protein